MNVYLAEFIGTTMLVFVGNCVVAGASLNKTKSGNVGWLFITTGWALAVMIPALIFGKISGAHFNPALTVALAVSGRFKFTLVPGYIAMQFLGSFTGAILMYLYYRIHFNETTDKETILAVFCTGPAIKNIPQNLFNEAVATFMLVFMIIGINNANLLNLNAFGVGGIISIIGIAFGGTTGYAINPARDLSPRLAHFLLPIKFKGDSNWSYSWIPVVGPMIGGVCGALLASVLF